jgi:histidinol-phosphate aminotransferase
LDTEKIIENAQKAKILFICSPNNPSGNDFEHLEEILQKFEGIIFMDEAYIDFSSRSSMLHKIENYPQIIVSQTMSKAWGLAAARIGIAYADKKIIDIFNKVKAPYNVSSLNQEIALQTLQNVENYQSQVQNILEQRRLLETEISHLSYVVKVYPSDANFLLVEFLDAEKVYKNLVSHKIIIRNRAHLVPNTLRITVGTKDENKKLIEVLQYLESIQ